MGESGGYRTEPFGGNRRMVAASAASGRRSDTIHLMTEVDISWPRRLISEHRERTGERLSLTGYVVTCLARPADARYLATTNPLSGHFSVDGVTHLRKSCGQPFDQHRGIMMTARMSSARLVEPSTAGLASTPDGSAAFATGYEAAGSKPGRRGAGLSAESASSSGLLPHARTARLALADVPRRARTRPRERILPRSRRSA